MAPSISTSKNAMQPQQSQQQQTFDQKTAAKTTDVLDELVLDALAGIHWIANQANFIARNHLHHGIHIVVVTRHRKTLRYEEQNTMAVSDAQSIGQVETPQIKSCLNESRTFVVVQ